MSPEDRPDFRLQQRDYLLRIARAMTGRLDLENVLSLVIQSAVEMAHGRSGAIALRQPDGRLKVAVSYGLMPQVNLDLGQSPGDPARQLPPPAESAADAAHLARRAEPLVPDVGDALADAELEAAGGTGLSVVGVDVGGEPQQMLALPLSLRDEEVGMILVFRSEGAAVFTPLDSELLDAFADQAAVAIHNARLHARLQARERQLEAVVEHDPSGVLLADARGVVRLDNPALRSLVGADDEGSLVGQPLSAVLQLEEESGRALPLTLPDDSAPTVVRGYLRRPDGGRGPFTQVTVTAVRAAGVGRDSYVADVVDLSAFKAAEDAKSSFLAGLSHELKTPLSLIRGYAETLKMSRAREDEALYADAVSVILNETDHLTRMVDQLLTAARLQSGGLGLQFDEVELGALLERLTSEFSVAHPDRAWQLDIAPDLPTVMADPTRLREVFQNLLTNAWKYSDPSTTVLVRATAGPDAVRVDVADQGIGIAAEDQDRVFERFFRASDRAEGAGLGLFMCRAIVEAHGGTITLASAPGAGSTFTVALPIAGHASNGETVP